MSHGLIRALVVEDDPLDATQVRRSLAPGSGPLRFSVELVSTLAHTLLRRVVVYAAERASMEHDRDVLRERLFRASKLESLGTLAGGLGFNGSSPPIRRSARSSSTPASSPHESPGSSWPRRGPRPAASQRSISP